MRITYKVSAQELIDAGAKVTQVRQGYRKADNFAEEVDTGAQVRYRSTGSFFNNYFYDLPAKLADGTEVTAATSNIGAAIVVWGGSVQDSYVQVTLVPEETD